MKLLRFFMVAILSIFTFMACDKEEVKLPNPERLITKAEVQNSDNKFDYIGQYHNDYLDAFIKVVDTEFKDGVNRRNLSVFTRTFYASKNVEYNGEQVAEIFDMFKKMQANGVELSAAFDNPCDYIPVLCGTTGPFLPSLNFVESGNNTERFLDYIERSKRFESQVLSSDKYTDEQKNAIMMYTAIGRYSHQYWHNQSVLGENGDWDDYLDTDSDGDGILEPAYACDVCKDDIAGAAVGAGVGAFAAGVGAGPGALAGGVTASAHTAIVEFLDWLW